MDKKCLIRWEIFFVELKSDRIPKFTGIWVEVWICINLKTKLKSFMDVRGAIIWKVDYSN